ncbi:zinc-ribbon domain-containing protein [Candidatus Micrarchaeota archaeon]|nr:zinc-ribbon domain-containing protein [Candidatus Micrarchaeota archaeon]
MYVCPKCGKEIEKIEQKFVRCPYCGSRILMKKRPPIAKEVSTD